MNIYCNFLLFLCLTICPVITPDLWAAITLESMDANQIIAQNPLFQAWTQQNIDQADTKHAIRLAEQLSWGHLQQIHHQGGIYHITLNTGCPHQCQGCIVGCDLVHQKRRMSWENFQEMVYRLNGFQTAMDAIFGKNKATFITPNSIRPFFDSDPMMTMLPDRNGKFHTIADAMIFFRQHTGRMMYILTSGWTAKSTKLQAAAEVLVQEQLAGKNNWNAFFLELKPFTLPFIENIKKIMASILLNEPSFINQFTNDFNQWGMEIDHYSDPPAAWKIYNQVVFAHWEEILRQSKYFQERLANIKTLLPVLQKYSYNTRLVIYSLTNASLNLGHHLPRHILPFLDSARMRLFLKNYFWPQLPDASFQESEWYFSQRTIFARRNNFNTIRIGTGGDINFTNGASMFSTDQTAASPFIESLTHQPVFFNYQHQPWQEVASRLTKINHRYLSSTERDSIEKKIITSGILEMNQVIGKVRQIQVGTHVDFDLALNDVNQASVQFIVTDQRGKQHQYRFVFPDGNIVRFNAPLPITLTLVNETHLFIPNPRHISTETKKLIFAFQHFPERSYQRALALFGFIQEQRHAIPTNNQRLKLTIPQKSLYKALLPLLASGLPLLEQQTIELLSEYLPNSKVIDELVTLFPIYNAQLSSSDHKPVLNFICDRIILYLQNGWINDPELEQLINLFRSNLGANSAHTALRDLAAKILNHPFISKLFLDRFFDLIDNLEFSSYPNLLALISAVTNSVIQVPILNKMVSFAIADQYFLQDHLEKYLMNQKELSREAQEILFSFINNHSLETAGVALRILYQYKKNIPRLIYLIIRFGIIRNSNSNAQISALAITANSTNINHLRMLDMELDHVAELNYSRRILLIDTLKKNSLCNNTQLGRNILTKLQRRFDVKRKFIRDCHHQAEWIFDHGLYSGTGLKYQ